jgi:ketosteroid isomerase-like protein
MPETKPVSNVDVLRKAFEAFNTGDMATLTDLIAENAVWHWPGQGPLCGVHQGRDAIFTIFGRLAELCPDFRCQVIDILGNDERGVALFRAVGSRPGKTINGLNVEVFRMKDGKATEWWSYSEDQRAEDEFWS